MANTDNECKDLGIEDVYADHKDHLAVMLNMQQSLQDMYAEKQGKKKFEDMTLREVSDFWLVNEHALTDEMHEAFDALGGIKDGIGNAIWKPWKSTHTVANDQTIKDLSEEDLIELKFEVIDMWHFMMNYWISIGGKPTEFFNMYMAKNKENFDRQERGY